MLRIAFKNTVLLTQSFWKCECADCVTINKERINTHFAGDLNEEKRKRLQMGVGSGDLTSKEDIVSPVIKVALFAVAILIMIAIVLCLICVIFLRRQRVKLSPAPYKLSRNSRRTLTLMSEQISSKDPISWCSSDNDLLWMQGEREL